MATAAKPIKLTRRRDLRRLVGELLEAFADHNLLTYASAIAFQALVALVPLTLLVLGLLGAFGLRDVWSDSVAPAIQDKVSPPVFRGIDHTVEKIVANGDGVLIAFAAVLALWYLTTATRTVMEALNQVHEVKDDRPYSLRLGLAVGLGAAAGVCLVGSSLLVAAAPRAGSVAFLLSIGRWVLAVLLIGLVIGLLLRYAPAEHPAPRWASAGSILIVAGWLIAATCFRFYIVYAGDFTTPIRSLAGLLVLTGFLFMSAIVFLVGAQVDELLRKRTRV